MDIMKEAKIISLKLTKEISDLTVNMQKKRADDTNAPSPDTEELLNIYVELEPMGKHIVIAEAYNQYNNQLREKARHN